MRGACWILSILFALVGGVGAPLRADTPSADHEIGKEGNPNPFPRPEYDGSLWEQIESHWDEGDREAARAAFKPFWFHPNQNFLLPRDAENLEIAFQKLFAEAKDKKALIQFLQKYCWDHSPRWSYQKARLAAEEDSDERLIEEIEHLKDFMKRIGNPSEENIYGLRMELYGYTAALRTRLGAGVEALAPKGPWDSDHLKYSLAAGKLLLTGTKFGKALDEWEAARGSDPKSPAYRQARARVVLAEYHWSETLKKGIPEYSAEKARALAAKLAERLPASRYPQAKRLAGLPVPPSPEERALPEGLKDQTTIVQSVLEDGRFSTGDTLIQRADGSKVGHVEAVDFYGGRSPGEFGWLVCEYGRCHNGAMENAADHGRAMGAPVELIGSAAEKEIPEAIENLKKNGAKVLIFTGHGDAEAGVLLSTGSTQYRLNAKNLDMLAPYVGDFEYVLFNSCSLGKCRAFTDNFSLMSGVPALYNDHDLYSGGRSPMDALKQSKWIITVPDGVRRPSFRQPKLSELVDDFRTLLRRVPAFQRLLQ